MGLVVCPVGQLSAMEDLSKGLLFLLGLQVAMTVLQN